MNSEMTFDTPFRGQYKKTKAHSLRCFPTCCDPDVHFERSFCGSSVRVRIRSYLFQTLEETRSFAVCGEFHIFNQIRPMGSTLDWVSLIRRRGSSGGSEGIVEDGEENSNKNMYKAELLEFNFQHRQATFIFRVSRKWHCHFPFGSHLGFTAYLIHAGTIIDLLTSPPFELRKKDTSTDLNRQLPLPPPPPLLFPLTPSSSSSSQALQMMVTQVDTKKQKVLQPEKVPPDMSLQDIQFILNALEEDT